MTECYQQRYNNPYYFHFPPFFHKHGITQHSLLEFIREMSVRLKEINLILRNFEIYFTTHGF